MRIEWDRYHVHLLNAGRAPWQAGVEVSPTYDKETPVTDFGFNFFTRGRGTVTTPRGRERLGAGVCLWRRPGWSYDIRQDPKKPIYNLFMHFELRDAQGKLRPWDAPLPPEVLQAPSPAMMEATLHRIVDLICGRRIGYSWAPPAGELREVASAMMTSLLMDLDRDSDRLPQMQHLHKRRSVTGAAQRRNDRFMHVISQMIESPERLPTVSEMAQQTGYTRAHFSRAFMQLMEISPQHFIISVRINRAQEMLLGTSESVTEIAESLGYPDVFHFSKQFKQWLQLTPTEFRARGRAQVNLNQRWMKRLQRGPVRR